MANFTALKTAINNAIKTNGNEEITGAILQAILDAMVETLGDSAITDLENAITTEVTNRENAVGGVAEDLAAEALARANKDNQLDGRINQEEYNRANADAALSQTMSQGFQTLGSQMTALNAAISALNAAYQNGYLYGGIATPSSSPSNNKCFYIALQGGTYTNFGGVGVVEGINIIKNDSGWKVEHIYDQTTLLNEFYLLRQQVIQAITSFDPIVIEGDVTNAPDEEDLTSNANHLLQFKNNAYSPLEFSGLGRKYLRKNIAPLSESAPFNGFVEGVTAEATLSGTPTQIFWDRMNTRFVGIKDGVYYLDWTDSDNYVPVSTSLVYMYNGTPYQWTGSDFIVDETEVPNLVNCLTQDMINEANTIYIIRYDYTLKENITIPANCVLEFDGGSISGEHTITGTNTGIQAGLGKIFSTDVTIDGSWNISESYPEWFGCIPNNNSSTCAAVAINKAYSICKNVKLGVGYYEITTNETIDVLGGLKGTQVDKTFIRRKSPSPEYTAVKVGIINGTSAQRIKRVTISQLTIIVGESYISTGIYKTSCLSIGAVSRINIENFKLQNFCDRNSEYSDEELSNPSDYSSYGIYASGESEGVVIKNARISANIPFYFKSLIDYCTIKDIFCDVDIIHDNVGFSSIYGTVGANNIIENCNFARGLYAIYANCLYGLTLINNRAEQLRALIKDGIIVNSNVYFNFILTPLVSIINFTFSSAINGIKTKNSYFNDNYPWSLGSMSIINCLTVGTPSNEAYFIDVTEDIHTTIKVENSNYFAKAIKYDNNIQRLYGNKIRISANPNWTGIIDNLVIKEVGTVSTALYTDFPVRIDNGKYEVDCYTRDFLTGEANRITTFVYKYPVNDNKVIAYKILFTFKAVGVYAEEEVYVKYGDDGNGNIDTTISTLIVKHLLGDELLNETNGVAFYHGNNSADGTKIYYMRNDTGKTLKMKAKVIFYTVEDIIC